MTRDIIWRALLVIAIVAGAFLIGAAAQGTEGNQVDDWCETGIKYEPVATPFVVPDPPEGTTWTILVLKAGTENSVVTDPVPGQAYSHPNGKEISHAILCYENTPSGGTTSTTSSTVVSTPSTTSSTSISSTTTTAPATTTSSSTSTTSRPQPTTTGPSTTVPPTTPIPRGINAGEAPEGGVAAGGGAMAVGTAWYWYVGAGLGIFLIAGLLVAFAFSMGWWGVRWR